MTIARIQVCASKAKKRKPMSALWTKLPIKCRRARTEGQEAKRPPRGGGSGAAKSPIWQFMRYI
jgi:hypothetical protein